MTREEAIKNIKEQMDLYVWQLEDINKVVEPRRYEQYRLAIMSFEMAIKALEQQPCEDASDNTYQIRYKNWHDNELPTDFVKDDILHTPDEAYNRGLNDAWNLAKKIVLPEDKGGYTADELEDIFGKSAFTTLTAQEALAKVKAYGEECNEIKVGDEIQSGDAYVVVTWKSKDEWNGMLLNDCDCGKAGACYTLMKGFTDWHKTGRHYHQISEILSQTKGEAE